MPRETVGPHTAEEEERDHGNLPRRQDEAQVGRGSVQRDEHGECQRDRCHRAPEARRCLTDEEKAELPLAQRAEAAQVRFSQ
jgi:hypothetical protein